MVWCLYTIENQVNGKQYIGISSNVAKRWLAHKSGYGSKIVYQAIKKYGLNSLKFDILCEGCEEDIKKLEIAMIEKYNSVAPGGYNLTTGGEGTVGFHHSKETRRKIATKTKGRQNPHLVALNAKQKGSGNPRARRVLIGGVEYDCIKYAVEATGIKASTLYMKMRRYSKAGWPSGWRYLDK